MKSLDEYQKQLVWRFLTFRPKFKGDPYPPYHVGAYLEEHFYHEFLKRELVTDRYYIPVFWTNVYLNRETSGLQQELNQLDPTKKYFTISQHDDAILEDLPPNTIHFNAGGNKGGVPIPLVCSSLSYPQNEERDILCSFVGSITHPIRNEMMDKLSGKDGFNLYAKNWSANVPRDQMNYFLRTTSRSKFSLCPRGYGASSFRIYEALQLGAVPVIIYDKHWFPYDRFIDWRRFSILVHESQIDSIPELIKMAEPHYEEMAANGSSAYEKLFALQCQFDMVQLHLRHA